MMHQILTVQGWTVTAILVATLAAFGWGRIRPDVVVMTAVLALGLSGVVGPTEAFRGFSDPTVVTIAALFVISAGVDRTGVAARIARSLLHVLGSNEVALVIGLMIIGGVVAGFVNIIASTAVLLPVALAVCRETGISPSRLLMPLAISSRLGGALTLVGKPSNLIVNSLLVQAGFPSLSFFAFFPVGVALLVIGIAFMATGGRRLLPSRMPEGFLWAASGGSDLERTYQLPERLFRIHVDPGSPLAGRTIEEAALGRSFGITIMAISRGRRRTYAPDGDERLSPGDELLIVARPEEVERLRQLGPVEVAPEEHARREPLETEEIGLAEVVIAPRSDFTGRTLKDLEFRQRYGLNVVAIWRSGRPRRTWLGGLPLQLGDALLLQGPRDRIRSLRRDPNFVSLDKPRPLRLSRAPFALLAVLALVGLGTSGVVPLSLAALLGAGIVVVSGCVAAREAFEVIDWPTVFVIGGLLPLGEALRTTGAAAAIADTFLPLAGDAPVLVLTAVLLASILIGHLVPSVPTTILMAPIALSAAGAIGSSPVPFAITVASATSVTLLTPISHPVSLMVMGPGGYRFRDYVRVGAPLALLLTVALLAVAVTVWPL